MGSFTEDLLDSTFLGDALTTGDAEEEAAEAQQRGLEAGISEQRAARESFEQRTDPFRQVGLAAGAPLLQQLGISIPQGIGSGTVPKSSGGMQQLEEINPLVSFLRDEGFRDIQESAAARGTLRSGGTLEDLTRFNTNLAATVAPQLQQQRFNQLFNVLGLGANTAAGQGTAALQTGANIANLQSGIGQAQAQGILGQEAARDQLRGDVAGVFGFGSGGGFGGGF
jgi:hypothetical protein